MEIQCEDCIYSELQIRCCMNLKNEKDYCTERATGYFYGYDNNPKGGCNLCLYHNYTYYCNKDNMIVPKYVVCHNFKEKFKGGKNEISR